MSLPTKDENFIKEVSGWVKGISLKFSSPKKLSKISRKTTVRNELIGSSLSLLENIQTGWDNRNKKQDFGPFLCGKASLNLVKRWGWSSLYCTDLLGI
jgi:hypothetical protein